MPGDNDKPHSQQSHWSDMTDDEDMMDEVAEDEAKPTQNLGSGRCPQMLWTDPLATIAHGNRYEAEIQQSLAADNPTHISVIKPKRSIGDLHAESLKHSSDKLAIYKQWVSTYDQDVAGESYQGPQATAAKAAEWLLAAGGPHKVFDAGCGTGLVGVALSALLPERDLQIDGCDISLDMLDFARGTGKYGNLWQMDLNLALAEVESDSYDVVLIVGTFIHGHVRPDPALPELVRVLRPGGKLLATIRKDFYDEQDFESTIQQLKLADHTVEHTEFQYLRGVVAKMVTVIKNSSEQDDK